jgi:hypothetical protein
MCSRNTVCPADMVLKAAREPNRLIALFLGKIETVLSKCKLLILDVI